MAKNGKNGVAAVAWWFRLRLQSAAPGSNPKHKLTIYAFSICIVENKSIVFVGTIKRTKIS